MTDMTMAQYAEAVNDFNTKEMIKDFVSSIDSFEDLKALSQALKQRWDQLTNQQVTKFNYGDEVEFDSKRGMTVTGTITKINTKTIKIKTPMGLVWNVSPGLLRKVKK